MANFKVAFEIEVEADSPLNAAVIVQDWLQDVHNNWQFLVQEEGKDSIYSVDLEEIEGDEVVELTTPYEPLIKNM